MAISPGGRPADASPIGTPGGRANWVDKAGGLPRYMRMIAHALMRKGMSASHAIATAHEQLERLAATSKDPKVKAAAAEALAEWKAKADNVTNLSSGHIDVRDLVDLSTLAGPETYDTLDLAAEAADADAVVLDLSRLSDEDAALVLDLAPGDGRPPYHWKHGYIPITPAAALSKAKGNRTRAAKLLQSGGNLSPADAARKLSGMPGSKSRKRVAGERRRPAAPQAPTEPMRPASTPEADAAARGRGVAGPSNADKIRNAETMFGTGSKQHKAAQQRFGGDRSPAMGGSAAAPNPGNRNRGADAAAAGKKIDTADLEAGQVIEERSPITGKTKRLRLDKVYSADREGNRNADVTDLDTGKSQGLTLMPGRKHNVTETGRGDASVTPIGGRRQTPQEKWDTAPKRHAEGDRVSTEYGHGTVEKATPGSMVIKLDNGETIGVRTGTPGYNRVKALSPADDSRGADGFPKSGPKRPQDMSSAEIVAEQERLSNYLSGMAGGTASREDRDRWQARRRELETERQKRVRDGMRSHPDRTDAPKAGAGAESPAILPQHATKPNSELRKITERHPDPAVKASARAELERRAAGGSTIKTNAADPAAAQPDLVRDLEQRRANRAASGATDGDAARKLSADRVSMDGVEFERVESGGRVVWRSKDGNRTVTDPSITEKLNAAAPMSGSVVRREQRLRPENRDGGVTGRPADTRTDAQMEERRQRTLAAQGRDASGNVARSEGGASSDSKSKGYRDLDGPRLVDEVAKRGILSPQRASQKSDAQLRTMLKDHDRNPNASHEDNARARAHTPEAPAPEAPASSTKSTNPDASMRVEHTPDGTLVHGTDRGDTEATSALKEAGFKWSRNLGAWYLPRTWNEPTREQRVRRLEAKLGDRLGVDRTTGPRKSAAEREQETRDRAAARAERMDARAQKAAAESESRRKASDAITDRIPMGQPILVGHHSERRHRRDLERSHSNMQKSWEAQKEADRAAEAADRARRTAAGDESKVTIGNRIDRNEAALRDVDRKLNGTSSALSGKATGEYRDRLLARKAELEDAIQHDRGKLDAAGGVQASKDTVKPGDFVKIRGQWYPVRKSNDKTVGVPNSMIPNRNSTSPWREVQEHKSADEVTREDVANMIRGNSTAFPEVNRMLAEAAPSKEEDAARKARKAGRSAGGSENGQTTTPAAAAEKTPDASGPAISEASARRMSDAQLEDALGRLFAAGGTDTPSIQVLEKELDRRDREAANRGKGEAATPAAATAEDRKLDDLTYEAGRRASAFTPEVIDRLSEDQLHRAIGSLMGGGYDANDHPVSDMIGALERKHGRKAAAPYRGVDANRRTLDEKAARRAQHGTIAQQRAAYAEWVDAQASRMQDDDVVGAHGLAAGSRSGAKSGRGSGAMTVHDLFTMTPAQIRANASEEALRWFGQPGNEPLPFDAWRAVHLGATDRRAVESLRRRREQWLSEFG